MPSEGLLETIHRQWRDPFHGMLTLRVRIACETMLDNHIEDALNHFASNSIVVHSNG